MPDTAWAVNGYPPDFSRDSPPASVLCHLTEFRHVNDRELTFIAHLPGPYLTWSCHAFSHDAQDDGLQPTPLVVVWSLLPQDGSGGPNNLHLSYSTAVHEAAITSLPRFPRSCSQEVISTRSA